MVSWQCKVGSIVLLMCAGAVHAQKDVSVALPPTVASVLPSSLTSASPGFNFVTFSRVTPAESEAAIHSRTLPSNLNLGVAVAGTNTGVAPKLSAQVAVAQRVGGDAAPAAPASIAELARALHYDPDLIYEYVRNNIEYYPVWGVQKGAFGALLDNQGTAFDQAALMVALLNANPSHSTPATYFLGQLSLTAAQIQSWLGVDVLATTSGCAVDSLLSNGQIPIASINGQSPVTCPASAAVTGIKLSHVWVKVMIGGTPYVFDPSFKPHTIKPSINLTTATGYSASTYLTHARAGAALTNPAFVQNINRNNIRNDLTGYASNLATYLRVNQPAAALDDVVGGKTIIPLAAGTSLRQATLPYQDTSVAVTEWTTDIPNVYRPLLRIQYAGIDQSYTSDAIYGKRLTITYNASNRAVLSLDGAIVATGTTAVTPETTGPVTFTVTHGAYTQNFATQTLTQQLKAGSAYTYVIGNGWGPVGRGLAELHRSRLNAAKAAGGSDTSEAVIGSSLSILSATWLAQANFSDYILDRLARTNTLFHHQIGIAGFNAGAYVDLPGNAFSITSEFQDHTKEQSVLFNQSMHSSIFESTAVQQTSGVSAVSTVKLIDIAVANGGKIFDATPSNFTTQVQPNLTACTSAQRAVFQSLTLQSNYRLILPDNCNLFEPNITGTKWTGEGYFQIQSSGGTPVAVGSIISGGLAGGFSSITQPAPAYNAATATNSVSPSVSKVCSCGIGDPIDLVTGNFTDEHDDISVGAGAFPVGLSLQRKYNSGLRLQSLTLGNGWTHNFDVSATIGSDGYQGMGEDSALDAVTTIAEKMVALDLLTDTAKPLDKLVIATVGQRWFGDQLINNTVIVKQVNGEVFVKLPDGSYNPPPGSSARLTQNSDSTYAYEDKNRASMSFNIAGKIATYQHPSGVRVQYNYDGNNNLAQVQNSLGHALTFTTTTTAPYRITQVADGNGRTVGYGYDGSGNLSSFTDAAANTATFAYDQPGRMTQVFYPSNPTVPFVTNVYDTLGRVQTQTDANGKLHNYYFAGSRSEGVDPYNTSNVYYLDNAGRITRTVNPLGRITTTAYDGQGRVALTTLPEGNAMQYVYDDASCASADKRCTHNIKSITQIPKSGSSTLITSFTYEPLFNKVATVTDPRSQVTNYYYTGQGDLLTVTAPADSSGVRPNTGYVYTAYAPSGFPSFYLLTSQTSNINASNTVTNTTTYNTANKYVPLTTTIDAGSGTLNLTTTYTYDAIGNLTRADGPRSDVSDTVDIAYDAERRPIQTTNALGLVSRSAYDPNGRLLRSAAQYGAQWLVSCRSYTSNGKLQRTWGPATTAADTACPSPTAPVAVTDYTYDDLDRSVLVTENLASSDGGNRLTQTDYNADGSVKDVLRALGSTVAQTAAAYTYTINGKLWTVADAKNNLTTYSYDGFDRRVKTQFPDKTNVGVSSTSDFETIGYDNNGNVTNEQKRTGFTIVNTYDNLNRLATRTYSASSAESVKFNYDLLGRRTLAANTDGGSSIAYIYDNAGRLSSTSMTSAAGTKTLAYLYDPAGNRTRTTWTEDGFFVTYAYDALNRPINIKENGTVNLVSNYDYDDLSRRRTVTLGNNTTTSYSYDDQAGLSGLKQDLAGTTQDVTFGYVRNQLHEIATQNWNNDLYQWKGYTNGTRAYAVNGLNQYTTVAGATFAYDTAGNLAGDGVWNYAYNTDNRLKNANGNGITGLLYYDAVGRLRATSFNNVLTRLVYDGNDLAAEYDTNNVLLRRYVHGPGTDEPLVWYEGTGTANKSWLYADHLGSVIATADATGTSTSTFTYGPYGEPNVTTGSRFRYTGQQLLAPLNLYYYKARMYSPALGRFLQADPIGYVDDLNMYAYVKGNPISRVDPLGLWSFTFGAYTGPGFQVTFGNDNGNGFMTGRVGFGLGAGYNYDPNATIPGPAIKNPSLGGIILSDSIIANFSAGPITGSIEKGVARNYSNEESSKYGDPSYSTSSPWWGGIRADASIGAQCTIYSGKH